MATVDLAKCWADHVGAVAKWAEGELPFERACGSAAQTVVGLCVACHEAIFGVQGRPAPEVLGASSLGMWEAS